MKKNNASDKKLTLNAETVKQLTPDHLEQVIGGLGDIKTVLRTCLFNSCKNQ